MKESFVLYTEYEEHLSLLTMEQRGVLITAIFCFQSKKELPKMDSSTYMAFSFIKKQLERDNEKYQKTCERNAQNIRKRWSNSDTSGKSGIPNDTKNTSGINGTFSYSDDDNDYDNENVNEDDVDNDSGKDIALKVFLDKYPAVAVDIMSTAQTTLVDWNAMLQKFDESEYLRTKCNSLNWLIKRRFDILADKYKDKEQPLQKGKEEVKCTAYKKNGVWKL